MAAGASTADVAAATRRDEAAEICRRDRTRLRLGARMEGVKVIPHHRVRQGFMRTPP